MGMGMPTGTNQNTQSTNPNPNTQMPNFANLFAGMGGMGGMGQNQQPQGQAQPSNVNYKELYKEQLAQLKDMGFINEDANIEALKKCDGNVQFAVEKLLSMLQ